MEPGQLLTHLRRGTLEYCVLAAFRHEDLYAGDLIAELGADGVLVTSEGTVYPLLSRLRRDGLVDTTWQESAVGPPRRYYRLTAAGSSELHNFAEQWRLFRNAVDRVLKEGS